MLKKVPPVPKSKSKEKKKKKKKGDPDKPPANIGKPKKPKIEKAKKSGKY